MNSPLLVCADNLGRPSNEGWRAIAREFMDRPGVLLLGACREEDYHPGLAVGRTTIVDPKLDRELAGSISETLANRQVLSVLDVAEAFEASDGLLMEFLSMLLTGRRLRQVVEEQVSARMVAQRSTEREVLRYVATAHAVGVSLPAEVLETLLPGHDLAPALSLLNREHILVSDDERRWQGLHELRSTIARDYLHQFSASDHCNNDQASGQASPGKRCFSDHRSICSAECRPSASGRGRIRDSQLTGCWR